MVGFPIDGNVDSAIAENEVIPPLLVENCTFPAPVADGIKTDAGVVAKSALFARILPLPYMVSRPETKIQVQCFVLLILLVVVKDLDFFKQ